MPHFLVHQSTSFDYNIDSIISYRLSTGWCNIDMLFSHYFTICGITLNGHNFRTIWSWESIHIWRWSSEYFLQDWGNCKVHLTKAVFLGKWAWHKLYLQFQRFLGSNNFQRNNGESRGIVLMLILMRSLAALPAARKWRIYIPPDLVNDVWWRRYSCDHMTRMSHVITHYNGLKRH